MKKKKKMKEEGKAKCDPNDPAIIFQGDWTLTSDGKTLVMDGDDATFLEPLTATGMKIQFLNKKDPARILKDIYKFQRQ